MQQEHGRVRQRGEVDVRKGSNVFSKFLSADPPANGHEDRTMVYRCTHTACTTDLTGGHSPKHQGSDIWTAVGSISEDTHGQLGQAIQTNLQTSRSSSSIFPPYRLENYSAV
ncbi:hypothetical protein RvY_00905-1 [Ramazzottius varieornatus]|uniref:Uncharacterized protein n=1 Tax=Ramazzottius varieornatus TaxID=947166 RepID=A0A1D1UPS4_RAMVA|nr:hypothetical protein RvY_00905-1 [Ramazzottius varieornatus]